MNRNDGSQVPLKNDLPRVGEINDRKVKDLQQQLRGDSDSPLAQCILPFKSQFSRKRRGEAFPADSDPEIFSTASST